MQNFVASVQFCSQIDFRKEASSTLFEEQTKNNRKEELLTLAPRKNYKEVLKKMLVEFINHDAPLFGILEWLDNQIIQIESEGKVEARKGKHSRRKQISF